MGAPTALVASISALRSAPDRLSAILAFWLALVESIGLLTILGLGLAGLWF